MRNDKVIDNFIDGLEGRTANLYTDGRILFNYGTRIAIRKEDKIFLNTKRYSITTSRIQNMIRKFADNIEEVSEIELYKIT